MKIELSPTPPISSGGTREQRHADFLADILDSTCLRLITDNSRTAALISGPAIATVE